MLLRSSSTRPTSVSNSARTRGPYCPAHCSASADIPSSQPRFRGDDAVAQLITTVVGFKPFYNVMRLFAKRVMTQTAEKNGVPWRQRVSQLENTPEVYAIREEIEDKLLQYPTYYLRPFHTYRNGNLDWIAAFEAESATAAIAIRTWKDATLSPEQAQHKLRSQIFECIEDYRGDWALQPPSAILDVGCSVGISTRALAQRYPQADVKGLDLSPPFLAVAELQERREGAEQEPKRKRIHYMHGFGERTGLPDGHFDLVHLGFVIHECPPTAIKDLIGEAHRLLQPNGVLAITDNNPRSATIQNLPPAMAALMQLAEPWSIEYYQMNVEAALSEVGFKDILTKESSPRHRTILGHK